MQKFLSVICVLLCTSKFLNAQAISGFESWYTTNYGTENPTSSLGARWTSIDTFYQPNSASLQTNIITQKATPTNGGVNSGNAAISVGVTNAFGPSQYFSTSGQLWLGEVTQLSNSYFHNAIPYTSRPVSLNGFYKMTSSSINVDKATIYAEFYDNNENLIGSGVKNFQTLTPNYLPFSIPINWNNATDQTESLKLNVTMGGSNMIYQNLPDTLITNIDTASRIYLDDLVFLFPTGIQESISPNADIVLFPNPASSSFQINFLNNAYKNCSKIQIKNILGETIIDIKDIKNQNLCNITYLKNGEYFVQFYNQANEFYYGYKFLKE